MEEMRWGAALVGTICLVMTFAMAWWISDSDGMAGWVVGLLLWSLMAVFSLPFLIIVFDSGRTVAGLVIFVSVVGFLAPKAKKAFSRVGPGAPVK